MSRPVFSHTGTRPNVTGVFSGTSKEKGTCSCCPGRSVRGSESFHFLTAMLMRAVVSVRLLSEARRREARRRRWSRRWRPGRVELSTHRLPNHLCVRGPGSPGWR
ncbi:MAG TPA: hypothetical protein VF815_30400 [Myxococcaceae bacterium]